jgi:hypothetical protein
MITAKLIRVIAGAERLHTVWRVDGATITAATPEDAAGRRDDSTDQHPANAKNRRWRPVSEVEKRRRA